MKRRIILAGGSGFLGQVLAHWFCQRSWDVVVLTRSPKARQDGMREIAWDGETIGDWAHAIDGAEGVINLAGKSVNCRYHERNRREILESRLLPTRVLGEVIAQCQTPPRVWINSSTATIYRHTFGPAWDESGEIGGTPEAKDQFSIEVATAWEREFETASTPKTRKVAIRSAMVLGHAKNSVFPMLRRLTRFGLGGRMGSGRQFVSWIHHEDFCRAIEWLIEHDDLCGVVNVAAPNPLTNSEMMRLFRAQCGVAMGLPAPEWMLEAGAFFMRTETELIIKSRRVVPGRLQASGFSFRHSHLHQAVQQLFAHSARPPCPS